ncbi:alpha/beta hydrolase [Bacillus songklensis]|uniref:Alpha/beta hydrolase n=1 Tax=Bacillus songklensis TaxID=1069116 RepID=A0ABV8BAG0_9BACI
MKEKYPVIQGAESFYFEGNEVGILISHGFMGTPQSVRFLGESLAKHGYTVYGPRLKGHGTHCRDLEKATSAEWFQSLEEGYKRLKRKCSAIFVMGQSMGGTLTLHLANKYGDIRGIILINSALTIPSLEYLRGKSSPRWVPEGKPDIKAKGVFEITYSQAPLTAIHELQQLMEATPPLLPNIAIPVLGMKSSVDHVVPPENTVFIMKNIGSFKKNAVTLHNSYHVASMDNDKEQIVRHCHQFIQQHVYHKVYTG